MARLAPLPPRAQSLATRVGRGERSAVGVHGFRPYGIWAHAPRAVPAAVVLNALFETGNWALEPALRKLVHLRVARIIGCVF